MPTLLDEIEAASEPRRPQRGGSIAVVDRPLRELSERAADAGRAWRTPPEAPDNAPGETGEPGAKRSQGAAADSRSGASRPRSTEELFNATSFIYPAILLGIIGIAAFNFLILLFVAVWMSLGGRAL